MGAFLELVEVVGDSGEISELLQEVSLSLFRGIYLLLVVGTTDEMVRGIVSRDEGRSRNSKLGPFIGDSHFIESL